MIRFILAPLCFLLLVLPSGRACAPVVAKGQSVHIADETAIILWDPVTKTQHFIRRASFRTRAPGLGFLVPTPTRPELSVASDKTFETLATLTQPRVNVVERPRGRGRNSGAPLPGSGPQITAPVRVLEERRLAGYQAAVLEADDAKALNDWLQKHGYVTRPELEEWFKSYIDQKWFFTAFKIDKDNPAQFAVATSAVRMSFKAEQPFYPYSEPAHLRRLEEGVSAGTRTLRIYMVTDARMQGQFSTGSMRWPGGVYWSNKLTSAQRDDLLKQLKLPENSVPANVWLTEFVDEASPRPAVTDLHFTRAVLQQPLEPAPQTRYVDVDAPPPPPLNASTRWIILGGVIGIAVVVLGTTAFILRRREADAVG